jgi:hypothetical protein
MKIYAINLANIPSPWTPVYNYEWWIIERNIVPTTSAICKVKTEDWRLKYMHTYDEGDPDGRGVQIRLADQIG